MENNLTQNLGPTKGTPVWMTFLHRFHSEKLCSTQKSCTVFLKLYHVQKNETQNARPGTILLGPFCLRRVHKKLIGQSSVVRKGHGALCTDRIVRRVNWGWCDELSLQLLDLSGYKKFCHEFILLVFISWALTVWLLLKLSSFKQPFKILLQSVRTYF